MASFFTTLLSPLSMVIILLAVGILVPKRKFASRSAILLAFFLLFFFSLPYTSKSLVHSLERKVHSPVSSVEDIDSADVAIVLGGGVKVPYGYRLRAELSSTGDRLVYAASLYLAGKTKYILLSGGNENLDDQIMPESELAKSFLIEWGVPTDNILIETDSISTIENARNVAKLLRNELKTLAIDDHNDAQLLLVSSAIHLPRAHALFCLSGVETKMVAANHLGYGNPDIRAKNWWPRASSLYISSLVLKEYFATTYYILTTDLTIKTLYATPTCRNYL